MLTIYSDASLEDWGVTRWYLEEVAFEHIALWDDQQIPARSAKYSVETTQLSLTLTKWGEPLIFLHKTYMVMCLTEEFLALCCIHPL